MKNLIMTIIIIIWVIDCNKNVIIKIRYWKYLSFYVSYLNIDLKNFFLSLIITIDYTTWDVFILLLLNVIYISIISKINDTNHLFYLFIYLNFSEECEFWNLIWKYILIE